jgi:hypothetical protein
LYNKIVWQSSTVGHTELAQIVSYYRLLNTDPEALTEPDGTQREKKWIKREGKTTKKILFVSFKLESFLSAETVRLVSAIETLLLDLKPGLTDFSRYDIAKLEKMYQNDNKIYQMAIKYATQMKII